MGFESLGKKLAQFGQDTKNNMAKMGETYQLNSRINEEKKSLNTLLTQIGAAVVERYADAPLEGLEDEFEAVRRAKENIADLEKQANRLRGVRICPECGKEAAKGEKFCSACGAKLPQEDDPAQKLRKDAREAGSEVGDIVNDAADKAKSFFTDMADKAGAFVDGFGSKVNPEQEKEDAAPEPEAAPETSEETGKAPEPEAAPETSEETGKAPESEEAPEAPEETDAAPEPEEPEEKEQPREAAPAQEEASEAGEGTEPSQES